MPERTNHEVDVAELHPLMQGHAHDSEGWRTLRNELLSNWVRDKDAERWLLDYFDVCELFDDMIDGDREISVVRVHRALWECLVDMPGNPFWREWSHRLLPVIASGINAWLDANDLEAEARVDPKSVDANLHFSYVMRAAYMQAVQEVISITRGRAAMRVTSLEVVKFFGTETYEEYRDKIVKE